MCLVDSWNPSIWETNSGGSQVQHQPRLQREPMSEGKYSMNGKEFELKDYEEPCPPLPLVSVRLFYACRLLLHSSPLNMFSWYQQKPQEIWVSHLCSMASPRNLLFLKTNTLKFTLNFNHPLTYSTIHFNTSSLQKQIHV